MSDKYRLTYFDGPARAEPIRKAFFIAGVDFVDERLTYPQYLERRQKGEYPFGNLPVLHIPGVSRCISQSLALFRYVGSVTGMFPTDPIEAMRADEINCALDEISQKFLPTMELEGDAKVAARKDFYETAVLRVFAGIEHILENTGAKDFCIGEKLSIVDLYLAGRFQWLTKGIVDHIPSDFGPKFPNIQRITKNVENLPQMKEYYKKTKKD